MDRQEEPSVSAAEFAAFLDDLRKVMQTALDVATAAYPGEVTLDNTQKHVFGLYRRAGSLFSALIDLISNDHVEAAMIVCRSFLTDCLTLRYFAKTPGLLEANVIKWARESLRQELSLEREGDRLGVESPDSDADSTQKELDELNEYAKSVPGSKGRLKDEKAMAKAIGDDETYWAIKFYSSMVHTTRMAIGRLMPIREGRILPQPFVSPVNLATVTSQSVSALFAGTEAIGTMFGWEPNDSYSAGKPRIEKEVKRLQDSSMRLQGINRDE